MKKILIVLALAVLLLAAGCTQTEAPAPVTPATTVATPDQTTVQPITTTIVQTFVPTQTVQPRIASVSENTIDIIDYAFEPASLTVPAGSTVRWVNDGAVTHRIQFADKSTSPLLSPGQSYSKIYDHVGVYDYICMIHPSMTGSITVT